MIKEAYSHGMQAFLEKIGAIKAPRLSGVRSAASSANTYRPAVVNGMPIPSPGQTTLATMPPVPAPPIPTTVRWVK